MATILLVDDDVDVCAVVELVLRGGGFDVLCATTEHEAQRHLQAERPIDLVITDVNLPGGGEPGLQIGAAALRARIRVLYTSAMGLREAVAARLVPGSAYLPKPFGPDQLMAAVRRLVAADVDWRLVPATEITPPAARAPGRSP